MWFCSGWGFRAFLDTVIKENRDDEDLVFALQQGKYHNGLHLELIREESPILARRVQAAIEVVAQETLEGKHRLWVNERKSRPEEDRMYREAVARLLEILKADGEA